MRYICEDDDLRFVVMSLEVSRQQLLFLKGKGEDVLDYCSHMMLKISGERVEMEEELKYQIVGVTRSMNRRLANSFGVAYKIFYQDTRQS